MNPALSSFAALLLGATAAHAATISVNSGSLGSAADGSDSTGVTLGVAGPLGSPTDTAAHYGGGTTGSPINTTIPFNSALNPASSSPFTIEFWVKPDTNVTDGSGPAPVFNRVSTSPRSGWVFFQRDQTQGWNFAMYNGTGSTVGTQMTGGTYTPGVWSQVVVTWDGTAPTMYVNGVNTNAAVTGPGGYAASTSAIFSIGSYDTGANTFSGGVDETAFYGTALSQSQIQAHFNAAGSTDPNAYSNLVTGDGALLYIRNAQVPEPASAGLLLLSLAPLLRRRRA
ncbi:MAG: cell surface protein [Akkermansiaceae bacterium]|nr:cell surface protein [Akkermansiaceae bacterium]